MNKNAIRADAEVCARCKYHMPFGSQPGKRECLNNNIACNYLAITGHSRIFQDGRMSYCPMFYDKFEEGGRVDPDTSLKMSDQIVLDVYDAYKAEKIWKERAIKRYEKKQR